MNRCRLVGLALIATLSFVTLALCNDDLLNLKEKSKNLIPASRLREIAEHVNAQDTTWEAEFPESWAKDAQKNFDLTYLTGTLNPKLLDTSEFKIKIKSMKKVNDDDNDGNDDDDDDDDSNDSDDEESKKKKDQNEEKAVQCVDNGLPKSFDARDKWPKCKSLMSHIYDQGNCGSCWAASAVSVFTDRLCIQSNGKYTELRSVQQVLSCCHKGAAKDGCNGGWPIATFDYIRRNGLSTGGDYDSKKGCQPYRIKPCARVNGTKLQSCRSYPQETAHKCKLHCYNANYGTPFKKDRIKVKSLYFLDPCAVMNDIHKHGPVVAAFAVYEDFVLYKKGVYQYTIGNILGWHAVRVIGWGEEKGTPYWLATNSWNESWGDKGYFKIIRDSPGNAFFQETVASCIVDV